MFEAKLLYYSIRREMWVWLTDWWAMLMAWGSVWWDFQIFAMVYLSFDRRLWKFITTVSGKVSRVVKSIILQNYSLKCTIHGRVIELSCYIKTHKSQWMTTCLAWSIPYNSLWCYFSYIFGAVCLLQAVLQFFCSL